MYDNIIKHINLNACYAYYKVANSLLDGLEVSKQLEFSRLMK